MRLLRRSHANLAKQESQKDSEEAIRAFCLDADVSLHRVAQKRLLLCDMRSPVAKDAGQIRARVVEDRNRFTGGGVTARIDFALHLAARLRNEKMAKGLQLAFEYNPLPPFQAGAPETAPPEVTEMMWAMYAPVRAGMQEAAKRVVKHWK